MYPYTTGMEGDEAVHLWANAGFSHSSWTLTAASLHLVAVEVTTFRGSNIQFLE